MILRRSHLRSSGFDTLKRQQGTISGPWYQSTAGLSEKRKEENKRANQWRWHLNVPSLQQPRSHSTLSKSGGYLARMSDATWSNTGLNRSSRSNVACFSESCSFASSYVQDHRLDWESSLCLSHYPQDTNFTVSMWKALLCKCLLCWFSAFRRLYFYF